VKVLTAAGFHVFGSVRIQVDAERLAGQFGATFTPLLFFPSETFTSFPFVPTLEGQYIIKNLVLIAAAIVVGSTVRGGGLVADPSATRSGSEIAPS